MDTKVKVIELLSESIVLIARLPDDLRECDEAKLAEVSVKLRSAVAECDDAMLRKLVLNISNMFDKCGEKLDAEKYREWRGKLFDPVLQNKEPYGYGEYELDESELVWIAAEKAAESLSTSLEWNDAVTSVGVARDSAGITGLIIYTNKILDSDKGIPKNWDGFDVLVHRLPTDDMVRKLEAKRVTPVWCVTGGSYDI